MSKDQRKHNVTHLGSDTCPPDLQNGANKRGVTGMVKKLIEAGGREWK